MVAHKTIGGAKRQPLGQDQQPLLLSVPEAARLLGVGTTLCWDMVHAGQVPSIRLGRRVLVPRAALERLESISAHDDSGSA